MAKMNPIKKVDTPLTMEMAAEKVVFSMVPAPLFKNATMSCSICCQSISTLFKYSSICG